MEKNLPEEITINSIKMEKFSTGAMKENNKGRGRYDLFPPEAMLRFALRLEMGANLYGDINWKKGFKWSRLCCSISRHFFQYMAGNKSEDHLAAIMCTIAFLMWHEEHKPELCDLEERR